MITIMLGVALLTGCIGALIGSTWSTRALETRFRHLAAGQRQLSDERNVLRVLREQHRWCPRCDGELRWEPISVGTLEDEDD